MAGQPLTPFGSALAGALGAVFSNAAVYPLDTVKTRLQALPPQPESPKLPTPSASTNKDAKIHEQLIARLRRWKMLSMLVKIVKTEGLTGVFKGFPASMINTFSQQFAYFFFHTFLRTSLLARLALTSLSTAQELLLGALAGALAQIFTIPVSVIATRQQLATSKTSPSLLIVGHQIVAEGGITALWTGLKPGLVLTVNPAITYGCFERMKTWVLSGDRLGGKLSVGEAFWLGVGSKTLATVVTYPYIFAKVRLQARTSTASSALITPSISFAEKAAHEPAPDSAVVDVEKGEVSASAPTQAHSANPLESGALGILRRVYAEEGVRGWYRGLGAQIIKAVLCQGILFVSKEQFEHYAILILTLLTKMRKGRLALAKTA